MNMNLYEDISQLLRQGGVDIYGVAGIKSFEKAEPGYRPQDILPTVQSVLVYGIRMFRFPRLANVDRNKIPEGVTEYTANFFIAANILDQLNYRLAVFLQDRGFKSLPIPAGPPYDGVGLHGVISHKYAAEMAGIGQRALCDLLLTKQYGPRIRLTSLLTEAALPMGQPMTGDLCKDHQGQCELACVKACPIEAISPSNGVDKWQCDRYNEIHLSRAGIKIRCGRCVWACPVGSQG